MTMKLWGARDLILKMKIKINIRFMSNRQVVDRDCTSATMERRSVLLAPSALQPMHFLFLAPLPKLSE